MIRHEEIKELEIAWGLREDVIEKDYVLGWVLWGIGSEPALEGTWIFKGGTCLKKCYLETYRFSEDLDFTILPNGPVEPVDVEPLLGGVLERISEESGIDFSLRPPKYKARPTPQSTEGRIYYRGPRAARMPASIKLDLDGREKAARPTVLREITHPYSDTLPEPSVVRAYSFEEVFAEKIRAMGERSRPRDLYDIINLFRRPDLREAPELIRAVLEEKCAGKGIPVTSFAAISNSPLRAELESEWENMLAHQLHVLPPLTDFWDDLEALFGWLDGTAVPLELAPVSHSGNEDAFWQPPATVWNWTDEARVPLEPIRFAGANHLCVQLGYQGSKRLVEPYSLRRSRDGDLLLHCVRVVDRQPRTYRVDRIESIDVTKQPFTPQYAIEFMARIADFHRG